MSGQTPRFSHLCCRPFIISIVWTPLWLNKTWLNEGGPTTVLSNKINQSDNRKKIEKNPNHYDWEWRLSTRSPVPLPLTHCVLTSFLCTRNDENCQVANKSQSDLNIILVSEKWWKLSSSKQEPEWMCEPPATSPPPSIGSPLWLSCGWTPTGMMLGFTLVM